MKTKSVKSKNIRQGLTYPVKLPKLTPDLQNMLDKFGIIEKQDHFIAFWKMHLCSSTNGEPSKTDYDNYARTIVDSYPILKGGKDGYVSIHCNILFDHFYFISVITITTLFLNVQGIVKTQLSTKVRNDRHREKKQLSKKTAQKHPGDPEIASSGKKVKTAALATITKY